MEFQQYFYVGLWPLADDEPTLSDDCSRCNSDLHLGDVACRLIADRHSEHVTGSGRPNADTRTRLLK